MARTKKSKDTLHGLKEVKVGGITYKIVRQKIKAHGSAIVMGQCDYKARVIRLNSELNREEFAFVLMHEILHAVHDATSCEDDVDYGAESFLHPFSRLFWDALRNAGLIDKKWLGV